MKKNLFKNKKANKTIIVFSVLICLTVPIQILKSSLTFACSSKAACQAEIDANQQDVERYAAQAAELAKQADTLENKVASLNAQMAAAQAELDLSQAKYDSLNQQILETENKIQDNKNALGKTIADMYVDDNITPIEMLASSSSVGDYMDKQEYRSSVRSELAATIKEIRALKDELTKQKNDVEVILNRQKAQQASLSAMQSEQQALLDETKSNEATYQSLMSEAKQKIADASAAQKKFLEKIGGGGNGAVGSFVWTNFSGNSPCGTDGYPYCGVQDSYSDPWQLYNRECVSYAAWALSYRFGKYVGPFNGSGNAYEWTWSAPLYSGAYPVSDPQPGDAVVLPAIPGFSPVGHLMIVESVDSGWVHVSQYNFGGTGQYSTMDIKTTGVVFLRFQDK